MAFVYSTNTVDTSDTYSKYGNVPLAISIFRDKITERTETKVSFKFGVRFTYAVNSTTRWMSNSIASWYDGKKLYANVSFGNDAGKFYGKSSCYSHYDNRDSEYGPYKTESTCYNYSNSSIEADTRTVTIEIGVGWNAWNPANKGTLKFTMPIDEWHGNASKPTIEITDKADYTVKISGKSGQWWGWWRIV